MSADSMILEDYLELVTYGFTNPMPDAEEGPWKITAKDIINGEINFSTARKTTQKAFDEKLTNKSRPKIGDVILTKDGTLGRLAIVQQEGICVSQSVAVLRPNKRILSEYLFYLLSTPAYQQEMIGDADGTVIKHIYITRIGKMEVDIPSIEVQGERLKHLLAIDRKIQLNRQTNQTLEQIAQAIFKSWFVDFEPTRAKIIAEDMGADTASQELAAQAIICGALTLEQLADIEQNLATTLQEAINTKLSHNSPTLINAEQLATTAALFPNALVESELGEIPEGWAVTALDEVAHYQNGLALQRFRPEEGEDSLPVLKIAQLRKGFADGEERASVNIRPECIVDNGDVIFSWSGSLIVDIWCGGRVALNQHLFKVTSQEYPKWFYYYWTKHHLEEFQRIAADKAVTMGHIKRSHLSQAKCLTPGNDLLQNSLFKDLLNKKILLRLESFSLEGVRDTLLPKLLSGELDVSALANNTETEA